MKIETWVKTLTVGLQAITATTGRVRHISLQAATGNAGVAYVGGASGTTVNAQQVATGLAFVVSDESESIDPSGFYVAGNADDVVRVFTIAGR